jgi:hypothetical protein
MSARRFIVASRHQLARVLQELAPAYCGLPQFHLEPPAAPTPCVPRVLPARTPADALREAAHQRMLEQAFLLQAARMATPASILAQPVTSGWGAVHTQLLWHALAAAGAAGMKPPWCTSTRTRRLTAR